MRAVILSCLLLLLSSFAHAAEPVLEITVVGKTQSFTREAMLATPGATTIDVARDITYGAPMTYRAVPVASLLAGLTVPTDSVIEAVAEDGFAAQLPFDLLLNTDPGKAIAWLAIEPADHTWPKLSGKDYTAGPFYIAWTGPGAAGIRSEQWPYQVAKLVSQPSPAGRWPALSVDVGLPATAVRAGETLFVTQCLPCHRLNGAGASEVGADLNRPMNPTEYLTPEGLHALIRNPKSVRTWPMQQMPGFPPESLSDREIDLVIAYLQHMPGRKKSAVTRAVCVRQNP
jgi:mono/diheme cytochrome c family protein